MTVEQFYDGPCSLVVAFKKANRIRAERSNFDSYLMGAYVYEAIQRNVPRLNPFVKEKPEPWMDEPYDLFGRDREETIRGKDNAKSGGTAAGKAFFEAFAARHNASLAEKEAIESKG